jgi:hypothetical protein
VLTCGATTTKMLTWNKIAWGHGDQHDGQQHHGAGGAHGASSSSSPHGSTQPYTPVPDGDAGDRRGYRVAVIQGARVYVPVGGTALESDLTRRDKAVEWINQWDTRVRFWVSGVVRAE